MRPNAEATKRTRGFRAGPNDVVDTWLAAKHGVMMAEKVTIGCELWHGALTKRGSTWQGSQHDGFEKRTDPGICARGSTSRFLRMNATRKDTDAEDRGQKIHTKTLDAEMGSTMKAAEKVCV